MSSVFDNIIAHHVNIRRGNVSMIIAMGYMNHQWDMINLDVELKGGLFNIILIVYSHIHLSPSVVYLWHIVFLMGHTANFWLIRLWCKSSDPENCKGSNCVIIQCKKEVMTTSQGLRWSQVDFRSVWALWITCFSNAQLLRDETAVCSGHNTVEHCYAFSVTTSTGTSFDTQHCASCKS